MFYTPLEEVEKEYQGESFYRELGKSDGSIWSSTESTYCELLRRSGGITYTIPLNRSSDHKRMLLEIPASVTTPIVGQYLLLVYLLDSLDPEIKDVVAEYKIEYLKREAT